MSTDETELAPTHPFGRGSISIGIYVYEGMPADPSGRLEAMVGLARLAERVGFDGITVSEHHRDRAGYMPNPLQLSGWYLEELSRAWAAPCPMVLPLRTATVVAEEAAWLDARFPGRVGLVVAAGADPEDFSLLDRDFDRRVPDFEQGLARVAGLLSGTDDSPLSADPALARCRTEPIPVAVAAMTRTGVRRAARHRAGVAFGRVAWQRPVDGAADADGMRTLLSVFASEGGTGPRVFTSQVYLGEAPEALRDGLAHRDQAGPSASGLVSAGSQQLTVGAVADDVIANMVDAIDAGMEAINLRVPYPGVSVEAAAEQIERIADEVLPSIRRTFTERAGSTA